MKNWKYGANPKKIKYARRKAQPGYRKAQATAGIGYVIDPKKPQNNPTRIAGRYEDRRPETTPLPQKGAPSHSPEEEKAEMSDSAR